MQLFQSVLNFPDAFLRSNNEGGHVYSRGMPCPTSQHGIRWLVEGLHKSSQIVIYATAGAIMLLTHFPSAKSILLIRHFARERQHAMTRSSAAAVASVAALARPLFDLFRKGALGHFRRRRQGTNIGLVDTLCVYDVHNHRTAVSLIAEGKTTYLCLRGNIKIQSDDLDLTEGVTCRIAIRYLLLAPLLAFYLIWRDLKRRRLRRTWIISLHRELITYMYVRDLLSRVAIKAEKVCISDCFATRSVAVVDYFQSQLIPMHMIQHGLIVNAAKYRSHADVYHVWSNYEESKLNGYVRDSIEFRYIPPPILRSTEPFYPEDRRILIVLNPVQGIGKSYPAELLYIIAEIAKIARTTVRLHPTDDRDAFVENSAKSGLSAINISSNRWADDLNEYSYFLVLNSTCILDIIYSNKVVATLGRGFVCYPAPNVADADQLTDVCSTADLLQYFRMQNIRSVLGGVIEKTLGIKVSEN